MPEFSFTSTNHFGMGIAEVRPITPFSKNNWDGVGIEPDVTVRAADALTVAESMALAAVLRAKRDPHSLSQH